MRIRLIILDVIASIGAYAMFAWVDWRLAVAMAVFEISNVLLELLDNGGKK